LKLLLAHGAVADEERPIQIIARMNNKECLETLLRHEADANIEHKANYLSNE